MFEPKAVAVATIDPPPPAPRVVKSAPPRRGAFIVSAVFARAAVAILALVFRGRETSVDEQPAPQPAQRAADTSPVVPSPPPQQPRPPQPERTTSTPSPNEAAPVAVSYSPATEQPTDSAEDAMVATLVVQSNPAGARVTVNGIGWGVTPVTIRNLPAGPKRLRLSKDGYVSQERTVVLEPTRQPMQARVTLAAVR
jgi:hypothetical protein